MSDVRCWACASTLEAQAAVFCSKCNHYQNWRRFLTFSTTSLSLLVALIAVTGAVAPAIAGLFETPAKLSVAIVDRGPIGTRRCTCPEVLFPVTLLITNRGDMVGAAVVKEIAFDVREHKDGKHHEFRYASPAPHSLKDRVVEVAPKSSKLVTVTYWHIPTRTPVSYAAAPAEHAAVRIMKGGAIRVTLFGEDGEKERDESPAITEWSGESVPMNDE